jgi:GTP-binding protein Era
VIKLFYPKKVTNFLSPTNFMSQHFSQPPASRCGFLAIVGKPNVGKSTLINRLVGEKISITCDKPQTTRHRILGIVNRDHIQAIFVDTPGFQKTYKNHLTQQMNQTVTESLQSVDVVLWILDGQELTAEDESLAACLPPKVPTIAVINKVDQVKNRDELLPHILALSQKFPFLQAIVPISALKSWSLDELFRVIEPLVPMAPHIYPSDWFTDQSQRALVMEIIREKIFRLTGDEIPYGTAVLIEQWKQATHTIHIDAVILTTETRHKAILIGKQGQKLKEIGQSARFDIEKLLDTKVMLRLWVKAKEGWENKPQTLKDINRELVSLSTAMVEPTSPDIDTATTDLSQ